MTETGITRGLNANVTPPAELLAKYAAEMTAAVKLHEQAKREERLARDSASQALIALNTAQRAFDKVVLDMHKAAPVESDWQREVKVATVGGGGGGGSATWSGSRASGGGVS